MNQHKLENLRYLRDVVIPWMEANPHQVDFDECLSSCQTRGCLGGWYCYLRYGVTDPFEMTKFLANDFGGMLIHNGRPHWYSLDPLFGISEVGTLEDRKERLDKLIQEAKDYG